MPCFIKQRLHSKEYLPAACGHFILQDRRRLPSVQGLTPLHVQYSETGPPGGSTGPESRVICSTKRPDASGASKLADTAEKGNRAALRISSLSCGKSCTPGPASKPGRLRTQLIQHALRPPSARYPRKWRAGRRKKTEPPGVPAALSAHMRGARALLFIHPESALSAAWALQFCRLYTRAYCRRQSRQ